MNDDVVVTCPNCGAVVLKTTKGSQCPFCNIRLNAEACRQLQEAAMCRESVEFNTLINPFLCRSISEMER